MPSNKSIIQVDEIDIDLRNRGLAAFLAWLVPGAGHLYQGRKTKAYLYFVCIMLTWLLGFALGGGHVVYASFQPGDRRWHYGVQAGVGAVALPALIQSSRMSKQSNPENGATYDSYRPLWGGFMAPPHRPVYEDQADEVSSWYARSGAGYEMGTWYTMIAGLLNILVIYDACSGPLSVPISGRRKDKDGDEAEANDDAQANTPNNTNTPNNANTPSDSGDPSTVAPAST